jgi:hypothetical protein
MKEANQENKPKPVKEVKIDEPTKPIDAKD